MSLLMIRNKGSVVHGVTAAVIESVYCRKRKKVALISHSLL